MAKISFKNNPINTSGHVPAIHTKAPDFTLVDRDLKEHKLSEFDRKKKILATVPSLDTGVCSTMAKHFNNLAKKHPEILFIVVSKDLPFAQKRFCEQENVHNVYTLSMMRDDQFGKDYGLLIMDGPLQGLLARSVFALDEKNHILYEELVPEITEEPHYTRAMEFLL